MSDRKDESEDIESAQKNQKKIGAAQDDPDTTGPAENLREEAAEMVDEDEESKEPA
jgi:DNA gyrase inhibitor GyrI